MEFFKNKSNIVLFLFLFAFSCLEVQGDSALDYPQIMEMVNRIISLKHGDPCSYADESSYYNRNYSTDQMEAMQTFAEITQKGLRVCNPLGLLVCSPITNKCVCGQFGTVPSSSNNSGLLLEENSEVKLVLEKDENGNEVCRWLEGESCFSNDIFRFAAMNSDFGCQNGTHCISMLDGRNCSIGSIVDFFLYKIQKFDPKLDYSTIKNMGPSCQCKI